MSVSKCKVGNRILTVLIIGLFIYLIAVFFFLNGMDTPSKMDGFQKTSVDNTPSLILPNRTRSASTCTTQ